MQRLMKAKEVAEALGGFPCPGGGGEERGDWRGGMVERAFSKP